MSDPLSSAATAEDAAGFAGLCRLMMEPPSEKEIALRAAGYRPRNGWGAWESKDCKFFLTVDAAYEAHLLEVES